MRPNYLQRIAESSTRTIGPLRAPAVAPPLMPGFAGFPSAEPRIEADGIEAAESFTQSPEESKPATQAAAAVASEEQSTRVAESHVKPARPKPAPPKPESRRSEIPRPHLALLQRLSPQRTTVRWPRLQATPPALQRAAESIEPQPAPSGSYAAAPKTEPPVATPRAQAQTQRTARVDSLPPQPEKPRIAPSEPQSDGLPGLRPAPRGDAPVTLSAPAPRRESRIRIGRIDVRLNNRPAVPVPARPAAAPPQSASNWLEARYLSAFALRP